MGGPHCWLAWQEMPRCQDLDAWKKLQKSSFNWGWKVAVHQFKRLRGLGLVWRMLWNAFLSDAVNLHLSNIRPIPFQPMISTFAHGPRFIKKLIWDCTLKQSPETCQDPSTHPPPTTGVSGGAVYSPSPAHAISIGSCGFTTQFWRMGS